MSRSLVSCLVVLCVAGGDDKVSKKKPAQVVVDCVKETLKQKGVHAKEEGKALGQTATLEGVMKGDFAFMKGAVRLYMKADKTLVESGDRFCAPEELGGAEGAQAAAAKNPAQLLAEFGLCGKSAKFDKDETLEGVECKIVTAEADKELMVRQVREMSSKVKEAKQIGDMSAMMDKQSSTSTYQVWVGKSDLRVYKAEWKLIPKFVVPPGIPIPPGTEDFLKRLEGTYQLTFEKYNEDIEVEVPKEVKKRLGIK